MPDDRSAVHPNGGYNLTRPLHGAVQAYGHEKVNVVRREETIDDLQKMSVLEISLPTLTHLAHPAAIWNRLGLPSRYRKPAPKFGPTGMGAFCVLVDISGYYQQLSFEERLTGRATRTAGYIETLGITKNQLGFLSKFRERRPFVLFYTGWRLYAPYRGDLSQSARFYPWHRFFLHPFLAQDAVEFVLLDRKGPGACGVGCDIRGLDHPLCDLYVDRPQGWVDDVLDLEDVLELTEEADLPALKDHEAKERQKLWPLHCLASQAGARVLEMFHMPADLQACLLERSAYTGDEFPHLEGRLLLLPHTKVPGEQALPVHALFAPGK